VFQRPASAEEREPMTRWSRHPGPPFSEACELIYYSGIARVSEWRLALMITSLSA